NNVEEINLGDCGSRVGVRHSHRVQVIRARPGHNVSKPIPLILARKRQHRSSGGPAARLAGEAMLVLWACEVKEQVRPNPRTWVLSSYADGQYVEIVQVAVIQLPPVVPLSSRG